MKTNKILYFILIAMLALFMVGCDKDEDAIIEFDELVEYMADNNLDLPAMLTDWLITAGTVNANPANYFVIDIRKGDKYFVGTPDFEDGHIPGAHSVALADVVTYEAANNAGNLPVVVACYSGHDSGHGVMALRLSGVSTAKSLAWGMSSWHSDFNLWYKLIGNKANDYPGSWVDDDASTTLPSFAGTPELETGLEDGAAILDYQISNAVVDGLNGILNTDVLSSYSSYDIYCYWAKADWDNYGHITGAYQLTPGDLGLESLDMLDPSTTNVIYCWSGQTASMIAAWLNAVGYDAKTLKFSANGMIYDDLTSHKWTAPAELDYVTGS